MISFFTLFFFSFEVQFCFWHIQFQFHICMQIFIRLHFFTSICFITLTQQRAMTTSLPVWVRRTHTWNKSYQIWAVTGHSFLFKIFINCFSVHLIYLAIIHHWVPCEKFSPVSVKKWASEWITHKFVVIVCFTRHLFS